MTSALYIPEKTKITATQKLLVAFTLSTTALIIGTLLFLSFLFKEQTAFKIETEALTLVIMGILVESFVFLYLLKWHPIHKKNFKRNAITGGVDIARPTGPLLPEQIKILTKLHSLAYSMYNSFWFLIPIFLIIDSLLTYLLLYSGITVFTIFPLLFVLSIQGAMIHYGMQYFPYYLDLISPVFRTAGACVVLNLNNGVRDIVINEIRFPIHYNQDQKIVDIIRDIKTGDTLEALYSPNSKHIWELRKNTENKNPRS